MTEFLASLLLFVGNLMMMVYARNLWKSTKGHLRGLVYGAFVIFGLAALVHAGAAVERALKLLA